MKIHVTRLKPECDLKRSIEQFVVEQNIKAGWIITCVGSLRQAHLRYANREDGTKIQGYAEIVSLTGTVSIYGCHIHCSVSDSEGTTRGGHLLYESLIYTTAELVIGESPELVFRRVRDGSTPWAELQVTGENEEKERETGFEPAT
jgi:uncharacterized protein